MNAEEYNIKLEAFEGPLALLLHLIEKNKIDIYDIPVAAVAEQYLAYLRAWKEFNMEVATEFLTMASTLLLIKSRMLLPKPAKPEDAAEEEEEDPRAELVERLIEYRRFREAGDALQKLLQQRQRYVHRLPQVFTVERALPKGLTIEELLGAFAALWETVAEEFRTIAREEITVQDKMTDILGLLTEHGGRLEFRQTLKRTGTKVEIVSAFLAILELIRLRRIRIQQPEAFGPIFLTWRE
ncbi:MAG: segregation/condensation protein A [Veillonellaceae bacterium]|nr:segregation/condensation protein A [Veillonellaceae bacterium]